MVLPEELTKIFQEEKRRKKHYAKIEATRKKKHKERQFLDWLFPGKG